VIEVCFPTDRSGFAVALRAFVDASAQGDIFCVAGIAFGFGRARKAQSRWRQLFSPRVIHMTDLHSRRGEFEGITPDEGGQILKDCVSIVNKHMQFFAISSCRISEMKENLQVPETGDPIMDAISKGVSSPYAWCVHTVMHHLGHLSHLHSGSRSGISYVIEAGDLGQGKVKEYIRFVEDHPYPAFRAMYGFDGASFVEKQGKEVLLQASDILCWEWAKHLLRKDQGKGVRPPLNAIFGGLEETSQKYGLTGASQKPGRGIASHYEGDKWAESLRDLCNEYSSPDTNQLASLYRENG